MAAYPLDYRWCMNDATLRAVGYFHLMDVGDTKRAVTNGGCKSVDDVLLSFTQVSLAAIILQVANHIIKTGAHVSLLDDVKYEVSISLHLAFRVLWLITLACATSNMPHFFCFGLLRGGN